MLMWFKLISECFDQICLISLISLVYTIYKINPYKDYGFVSFEKLKKYYKNTNEKKFMLQYKVFWLLIALFFMFIFSILLIYLTRWTEI